MTLTPEMNALFEEAAENEEHPLAEALSVLLRELHDVRPKSKDDKAELFHARRRRIRSGMTRAMLDLSTDTTLDYKAQLIIMRQLLVALSKYDGGDKRGTF